MEWERAKSYLIIFFLLLNAGLGVLLFMESRRYTVAPEQERLIRTVLDQNGISMYTMLMRRFPPMRPLEIRGLYYDTDALLSILFENPYAVEQSTVFGQQIFQYGASMMTISNGFITYENPYGSRNRPGATNDLTASSASALTNTFVRSYFPDFRLDSNFRVGDNFRIIYRQEYRGQLIHSNFIEFLVTPLGITMIDMQFGQVLGHTGSLERIFSPDEALLVFVQRVRQFSLEEPMSIELMDLVFFKEYVSDQEETYQAVPFYRIFTKCRADRPFLINAFTNTIID